VKVGIGGATLGAAELVEAALEELLELSSLTTFWSSAWVLPASRATLAAAAATLNLILHDRALSQAALEWRQRRSGRGGGGENDEQN